MGQRNSQKIAALQSRSIAYANGDRRRAVEMLAAALKGLLRTPGVAVNKEWSRRVS